MTQTWKIYKKDVYCRTINSQPTEMLENSELGENEFNANMENDEISHGTYLTFIEEAKESEEVDGCNIDVEENKGSVENNYTVLDEFKKTERVVSLGVYSDLEKSGKGRNIELVSE